MRAGRRLPSPALAVSAAALIVALSGTAIALPGKSTVGSRDIKDGAVKSSDLRDGGAVKPRDLTPMARLWAEVTPQGSVVGASRPDVVVDQTGILQGRYEVDFNEGDIGRCGSIAQISGSTPAGGIPSGQAVTELSEDATDTVRVETTDSTGDPAARGFTLVVLC
jgi:hypothetical protein